MAGTPEATRLEEEELYEDDANYSITDEYYLNDEDTPHDDADADVDMDVDFDLDEMLEDEDSLHDEAEEAVPRRSVRIDIPGISKEEMALVDTWWEKYVKMKGVDSIRHHLDDFMRDHPKLVPNLELHQEVLFELGADYVREGREAEYIDLLLTMRSDFTDAYLPTTTSGSAGLKPV